MAKVHSEFLENRESTKAGLHSNELIKTMTDNENEVLIIWVNEANHEVLQDENTARKMSALATVGMISKFHKQLQRR